MKSGSKMISVEGTFKKAAFIIKFKKHDKHSLAKAVETLNGLKGVVPTDIQRYKEIYYYLGVAHFYLDQYRLSLESLEEMLKVDPDHHASKVLLRKLTEKSTISTEGSKTDVLTPTENGKGSLSLRKRRRGYLGAKHKRAISMGEGPVAALLTPTKKEKKEKKLTNSPPASPRLGKEESTTVFQLEFKSKKKKVESVSLVKKDMAKMGNRVSKVPLTNAEELINRFSVEEYEMLCKQFKELAGAKKSKFSNEALVKMLGRPFSSKHGKWFVKNVFYRAFESISNTTDLASDNDGIRIDLFLATLAVFLKGDLFQQGNLSFEIFAGGQETITQERVWKIFENLYSLFGDYGLRPSVSPRVAGQDLFTRLDIRRKGKIERIDFITGIVNNIQEEKPSFTMFGTLIPFTSRDFVFLSHILLGMSSCVTTVWRDRRIRNELFFEEYTIALPVLPQQMIGIPVNKFGVHCHRVFDALRKLFGIEKKDFFMEFSMINHLKQILFGRHNSFTLSNSLGRSGAVFLYSNRGRFLVKKIPKQEFNTLLSILPAYYDHQKMVFQKAKQKTLLTKFLYAFRLDDSYYCVLENILPGQVHEIYDLKGSKIARSNPNGPVYKDNDLKRKLVIGPSKKKLLMRFLTRDVAILNYLKLTDYSLLLGIHYIRGKRSTMNPNNFYKKGLHDIKVDEHHLIGAANIEMDQLFEADGGIRSQDGKEIYYLGIIDCLTTFTLYKSAERNVKSLRHLGHRKDISSQPHQYYSERFLKFIGRIFE